MRYTQVAVAAILLLAVARPCRAIDWAAFEDPQAFLLTDAFAKSIGELPADQKAAAVQRLRDSLNAKDVEIRRRAALTLGSLGDKGGVPTMIEDLSRATGRDRDNVAVALRILKDERAVPALRKALKDKSPYIRGIAAAALGEVKAAAAYDDLVALTKDKEVQGGEKKDGTLNCLRMFPADLACYALGALGDQRAVPVLIGLVDDPDLQSQVVQALAALTNQKIGNDSEKWKTWWKSQGR